MRLSALALLLLAATILSAQTDPAAPPAAPRKVRPLPAGAVPVAPTPPIPAPAATVPKPVRTRTATQTKLVPSQGTTAPEDRAIEAAIKAKLAKSKIGKDGFTVRVQGGVAFWDGQTGVIQHKGAATRMAKTAGARQVVNNIKISEAARQRATANLAQGRSRAQLKRGEPRTE